VRWTRNGLPIRREPGEGAQEVEESAKGVVLDPVGRGDARCILAFAAHAPGELHLERLEDDGELVGIGDDERGSFFSAFAAVRSSLTRRAVEMPPRRGKETRVSAEMGRGLVVDMMNPPGTRPLREWSGLPGVLDGGRF
jgi:hypothetical protein